MTDWKDELTKRSDCTMLFAVATERYLTEKYTFGEQIIKGPQAIHLITMTNDSIYVIYKDELQVAFVNQFV